MEPDSIGNVHAVPVIVELDDVIHVRKAVTQMKCNKAFGGDGIPAGVYTHGDTTLVELKHASIVTIFKRGSCTECGYFLGSPSSQSQGRSLRKFSGTDCNISRKVLSPKHSAVSDQEETIRTCFLCSSDAGKIQGTRA